jgi:hypothetical protein
MNMMNISNLVKGQLTQTLVKILFERAGYKVIRLGIEELFQEIVHLDYPQYEKLGIPKNLRYLPDLLITDLKLEKAFLMEVKFRKRMTREVFLELYKNFSEQKKYWPDMYAIILSGTPMQEQSELHQDYIRILTPNTFDRLKIDQFTLEHANPKTNLSLKIWKRLDPLHEIFDNFSWKTGHHGYTDIADFIAASLQEISHLDIYSNIDDTKELCCENPVAATAPKEP